MKLSTALHRFFGAYLPHIRGLSRTTIRAYREAFAIFLPFAADYRGIKIASLKIDHLTVDLVLAFLDHLEKQRQNIAKTRNHRLAAIKTLAKMIRFTYPEKQKLADRILAIPQKRMQKKLVGFLYPDELLAVYNAVDLKKSEGLRDYAILHLLADSGARASEITRLNLDYIDYRQDRLVIMGKGDRYRQIKLDRRTVHLLKLYVAKYRRNPKPLYEQRLFINQRGEQLTRHGLYRLCRRYLRIALSPKRLKYINPVHSFRHSCAVNMFSKGESVTDVQNRLGHEDAESTMAYLKLDMTRRRRIQEQLVKYTRALLSEDPKIKELIDWENKEEILKWLDSL
jgi:site-specific recombinase XerD